MKKFKKLMQLVGLACCMTTATVSAVQVTFQVNMSVQRDLGAFDPNNDYVYVAGNFNGWSTTASLLTQSPIDSDVWVGTFEVGAEGTWVNYKYVMNRLVGGVKWEDNVGPGGTQNRYFQVPASDAELDVVYFNNITNAAVPYAPVTFQVDMSVQIAQGAFDPDNGTLLIAGGAINNWDTTVAPIALSRSLVDSNLWTITLSVTNPIGGSVAYKYIMDGAWESIANRTFIMTNEAQTLPIVFFNNVTNIAVPIPLTFQVNMGVQMALGNFNPDNGDIVEARGSFFTGSGGAWLGGFVLTNDPANPLIFSGTIVDTNDTAGSTIQYQFVLNYGSTWESTGNRSYVLQTTNATTLPLAFFNNVSNLGTVSIGPISGSMATLSWPAGTNVRLQSSTNLTSWQDVPGTLGQSSAEVSTTPSMQVFRLIGP
jgi:hypothetical protein